MCEHSTWVEVAGHREHELQAQTGLDLHGMGTVAPWRIVSASLCVTQAKWPADLLHSYAFCFDILGILGGNTGRDFRFTIGGPTGIAPPPVCVMLAGRDL